MRKFLNGERKFKKGEVVYYIENGRIHFGVISQYKGYGNYYIDLYCKKDCRLIDGVPISEVDFTKEYPLPKKWSYNTRLFELSYTEEYDKINDIFKEIRLSDSERIAECIEKGYFVKKSEVFLGYVRTEIIGKSTYKLKKERNDHDVTDIYLHESLIFKTYEDAEKYIQDKRDREYARKELFATMTDEEINLYEIREYLVRVGIDEFYIEKFMNLIKTLKFPVPLEDLEIRRFGDEIQYKDLRSHWICLLRLPDSTKKEKVHTEKYYVCVSRIYDLDNEIIFSCYTNEKPEYWFKLYSDVQEYNLFINNREWTFEKGLDEPKNYYLGVEEDESGNLIPTLVSHYEILQGGFDIVDGKLARFDITLNAENFVCNFFIRRYVKKTSLTEEEIREYYANKVSGITGQFAELFKEKIRELPIKC